MPLIKALPTFLIEGGGQIVCSNYSSRIASVVKSRIDIWGKHKKVYKSICLPTLRGFIPMKQLRKADLEKYCDLLPVGATIQIMCTTDKLDLLTIRIRRPNVI